MYVLTEGCLAHGKHFSSYFFLLFAGRICGNVSNSLSSNLLFCEMVRKHLSHRVVGGGHAQHLAETNKGYFPPYSKGGESMTLSYLLPILTLQLSQMQEEIVETICLLFLFGI